jgi:hypothetical protein
MEGAMPDPVTGLVVGGSSLASSALQSRAAGKAAGQQADAAQAGIEEQRRQFEEMQKLLAPYVQAGQPALQAQQAMLGLGGAEAQQQAIAGVEQSPLLQALMRQGEEAMLQQASATGGLRGGNMQAALAQFRPQMLQETSSMRASAGSRRSGSSPLRVWAGRACRRAVMSPVSYSSRARLAQAGRSAGRHRLPTCSRCPLRCTAWAWAWVGFRSRRLGVLRCQHRAAVAAVGERCNGTRPDQLPDAGRHAV